MGQKERKKERNHMGLLRYSVLTHSVGSDSLWTPWTIALQAPPSMGFSKREYWSGLPCPPPGDLPDPGIKPRSPTLQVDSLLSELPGKPIWDYYMELKSLHALAVGAILRTKRYKETKNSSAIFKEPRTKKQKQGVRSKEQGPVHATFTQRHLSGGQNT